jgi:serine/threonine protein kinase/tetratricopeptide (TPR) repeat protein
MLCVVCPSCGKSNSEFDLCCSGCGSRLPDAVAPAPDAAGAARSSRPVRDAAVPAEPLLGLRVSRYRVLEPLGRGGMGTVYRVQDVDSGAVLALKVVRSAREALLPRLRREIHALSRLRHPGIVRIVDEGQHEGCPWYAMELLGGPTLAAWASGQWPVASGEGRVGARPVLPERRMASSGSTAVGEGAWWTQSLGSRSAAEAADLARTLQAEGTAPARAMTSGGWRGAAAGGRLDEVLTLLRRLAGALAYLHGEGIVHRDLKPANIVLRSEKRGDRSEERTGQVEQTASSLLTPHSSLLTPHSSLLTPVLVDFGLTLRTSDEAGRDALELDWEAAGTPGYMAPEQIRGEPLDARADLYALGCVAYELLTGRLPFEGTAEQVMAGHLRAELTAPSRLAGGVPGPLDELVLRLLAKKPAERLGHAADVERALGELGAEPWPGEGLPRPRTVLYRARLAGRQEALGRLMQELERLERGAGGLVLIGGESGTGKTRLLLEAARRAKRRGVSVLSGECKAVALLEGGRAAQDARALDALRPALQWVADRCRARGAETTERLLDGRAKLLALYEPALAHLPGLEAEPEPAPLPAEAARLRLYTCLAETFGALAEEAAWVLVLDDLQWADELTLGFLELLLRGRKLERMRLLIVGTYRSEEASEPLRRLLELDGVRRLELQPLEEAAVGAMVGDMLAMVPPAAFVRFLARQAQGNPFFAAEYLRTAVHEALLWRDEAGRWRVEAPAEEATAAELYEALPLPPSIGGLLARRLERLGSAARRLAAVAAVLGKEAEGLLLAQVAAMGAAETLEGTLELLSGQVLEEAWRGRLRFVHDKLREVAYQTIPAAERAGLHRAAAQAIEGLPAAQQAEHVPALGWHWEKACDAERAIGGYVRAAERASAAAALGEAVAALGRALRLCEAGPEPVRLDLLRRRASARDLDGDPEGALRDLAEARSLADGLGDAACAADCLEAAAWIQIRGGDSAAALELARQSGEMAAAGGAAAQETTALSAMASALMHLGQHHQAAELLERVIARARQSGASETLLRALSAMGQLHQRRGELDSAAACYTEVLALSRVSASAAGSAAALANLGTVSWQRGQIEAARDLYQQALELHRARGDRLTSALMLGNIGALLIDLEDLPAAVSAFEEALEDCRAIGYGPGILRNWNNLAIAQREQGLLAAALEGFSAVLEEQRAVQDPQGEALALFNLGTVHVDCGAFDRAREMLARCETLCQGLEDRWQQADCLQKLGEAECYSGAKDRAIDLWAGACETAAAIGHAELELRARVWLAWAGAESRAPGGARGPEELLRQSQELGSADLRIEVALLLAERRLQLEGRAEEAVCLAGEARAAMLHRGMRRDLYVVERLRARALAAAGRRAEALRALVAAAGELLWTSRQVPGELLGDFERHPRVLAVLRDCGCSEVGQLETWREHGRPAWPGLC